MATTKPKASRKTPQLRLSLAQQLAHDHAMAVLQSTATVEILDEDGKRTDRLVYLGQEYASKFSKAHGLTS